MKEKMELFLEMTDIHLMDPNFIFLEKDRARAHKLNLERSKDHNRMLN